MYTFFFSSPLLFLIFLSQDFFSCVFLHLSFFSSFCISLPPLHISSHLIVHATSPRIEKMHAASLRERERKKRDRKKEKVPCYKLKDTFHSAFCCPEVEVISSLSSSLLHSLLSLSFSSLLLLPISSASHLLS